MKRILAIVLVALLGYFIYSSLFDSDMKIIQSDNRESFLDNMTKENGKMVYLESKSLKNGAANLVTGIVTDYRSFDTLGEVTVLFIASLGVAILLAGYSRKYRFKIKSNFILKTGSRIVIGLSLLFGVYMFSGVLFLKVEGYHDFYYCVN